MPSAEALNPKDVAQKVAEIARDIFGVELSAVPESMRKEVMDLILRCQDNERILTFAAAVKRCGFPKPLHIYLPRAPIDPLAWNIVQIPLDGMARDLRKALEFLQDDVPTQGFALTHFLSIFGETD